MGGLNFDWHPSERRSALSTMAMDLTQRAKALDIMKQQQAIQTQGEVAKATALSPVEIATATAKAKALMPIEVEQATQIESGKAKAAGEQTRETLRSLGIPLGGGSSAPYDMHTADISQTPTAPGAATPNTGFRPTKYSLDIGGVGVTLENPEAEAQQAAQAAADKEAAVGYSKIKKFIPTLHTIKQRVSELPHIREGIINRGADVLGLWSSMAGQTGEGGKAAVGYESFKKGLRSELGRMGGDVGNLSYDEQEAAMGKLPKIEDTDSVKSAKLTDFYTYIIERTAGNLKIPEEQAAKELGMEFDPATRKAVDLGTAMVKYGLPWRGQQPKMSGWHLEKDTTTKKTFIVYPDGTEEMLN